MSSFVLKVFACICMFVDHIGFIFLPEVALLRIIGRLAFPIFAFQVSIGYNKTQNKEKYILRLLLLTIISQIPFYLFRKMALINPAHQLNVCATLTLGLLAIYCLDKIKIPLLKYTSIVIILIISNLIPMDYSWFGILTILIFYIFKEDVIGIFVFYSILVYSYCLYKNSIFNLPAIYALLPIFLYNGKKGKKVKYLFYAFYPLHMLVLVLIKLKWTY